LGDHHDAAEAMWLEFVERHVQNRSTRGTRRVANDFPQGRHIRQRGRRASLKVEQDMFSERNHGSTRDRRWRSGEHGSAASLCCRLPILLVLIAFFASHGTAVARQEENSIQQRPGFMDGYKDITEGRFDAGIQKLKQVIEKYPDDPDLHIAYYNIACAYARS